MVSSGYVNVTAVTPAADPAKNLSICVCFPNKPPRY